jgi:AcrR family transcriptional regulator
MASRGDKAALRRRRLVDAARDLFGEHGFHGTGMAQIAEASGIRVGQIYRDFASKEDIIAAMVALDLSDFLDESVLMRAIAADDRAGVRGWVLDLMIRRQQPDDTTLLPEILAEASRNPRVAAIMREGDQRIRRHLAAALAMLAPAATPARARCVEELMMTLMMGGCSRRMALVEGDWPFLDGCIARFLDQQIAWMAAGDDDGCDGGGGDGRDDPRPDGHA